MPCYYDYPPGPTSSSGPTWAKQFEKTNGFSVEDLLTAFCSVCHALESKKIKIPTPLAQSVWAKHKAADEKRKEKEMAAEKADREVRELRKSGLEKLTKKERDALGLR